MNRKVSVYVVQVTKNKKWRDVSSTLGLGPSSSAGFTLKKNYGKHLFPFECRYDRGNIDPAPLLAFLEQPSKKESKKAAAERAAAAAGDYYILLVTYVMLLGLSVFLSVH